MRTLTTLLLTAGAALSCACVLALPDDAHVPVLTYHSWEARFDEISGQCDTEADALLRDLEVIHQEGYTPIPAYWLVEWVHGWRDGSTLPSKAVVLTFDDGHDLDYLDNAMPWHPCGPLRSIRSVLEEAAGWDWGDTRGMPVPHATVFVIGSPAAREQINTDRRMSDAWWAAAAAHPLVEVQNHGLDHDHDTIKPGLVDQFLTGVLDLSAPVTLPASDTGPQMTSLRIDTLPEARDYVSLSADYIYQRTGLWPDLFAYPFGPAPNYLTDRYFPGYWGEHGTVGAFCAGGGYVTRDSDPYCLPRLVYRASPQYGGWRDADELRGILRGR